MIPLHGLQKTQQVHAFVLIVDLPKSTAPASEESALNLVETTETAAPSLSRALSAAADTGRGLFASTTVGC